MKINLLAAAAVTALGLVGGSAANAATTVYDLNISSAGCCNLADYGTVTVSDISGGLHFLVELADGVLVNVNGNSTHHALEFDLTGSNIALSGFSTTQIAASGAIANASPFGAFDHSVVYVPPVGTHGNPSGLSSFSFDATGTNLALGSTLYNQTQLFFVADVFVDAAHSGVTGGLTGNVASSGGGGVPEPASWALMLVGFGGLGAMMRRRRTMSAVAA
jgi:hypothetical protein